MKKANRSNALLVELLIVVIFFMLASTVLLQVFTASSNQGKKAGAINDALVAAQNTADRLYAALSDYCASERIPPDSRVKTTAPQLFSLFMMFS